MKTQREIYRKLTGERKKNRKADYKFLRTAIVIDFVHEKRGLNCGELQDQVYGKFNTKSGLIYKWKHHKNSASTRSINKVIEELDLVEEFQFHPMFELFDDWHLSNYKVKKILSPYRSLHGHFVDWHFPNDRILKVLGRYSSPQINGETDSLVSRGDVYGFFAILGIVREAENQVNEMLHAYACMNLYRALPALGKLPYFAKHFDKLVEAVNVIRSRRMFSLVFFKPDMQILRKQFNDPLHEPKRELRPRDPVTWQFEEIEDPIIYNESIFNF